MVLWLPSFFFPSRLLFLAFFGESPWILFGFWSSPRQQSFLAFCNHLFLYRSPFVTPVPALLPPWFGSAFFLRSHTPPFVTRFLDREERLFGPALRLVSQAHNVL